MTLRSRAIAAFAFALCGLAGYFHPVLTLVCTWLGLIALHLAWRRAMKSTAGPEGPESRSFDYPFWVRYGGWMIYSGVFFVIFPIVKAMSPRNLSLGDLALDLASRSFGEWMVLGALLVILSTAWVVIPALALALFVSAPAIVLRSDGLRLVPMPPFEPRTLPWTGLSRVVSWRMSKGSQPVNYTVYLTDGDHFPIFSRPLRGGTALVDVLATHVRLERT